jgi:hypothetical protein
MYVYCSFQNGYTALMDAAELGNTTLVEMLVKARARTDLKTKVSPAPIRLVVVRASTICAVSVGRSSACCLSLFTLLISTTGWENRRRSGQNPGDRDPDQERYAPLYHRVLSEDSLSYSWCML